jgi:hypothetical protein
LLGPAPASAVVFTARLVGPVLLGPVLVRAVLVRAVLARVVLAAATLVTPVLRVAVLAAAALVGSVFIGAVLVGSWLARTVSPLALLWTALVAVGTVLRAARRAWPARARPLPSALAGRVRVVAGIGPGVRSLSVPGVWLTLAPRAAGGRSLRGAA